MNPPIERCGAELSSGVHSGSSASGPVPAEVVHVFAAGLYLAVDDPRGPGGPGHWLLPIMGPKALQLPFGLYVPQLDLEHLATLRPGTPARVAGTAPPLRQLDPRLPALENHSASPMRIEFPNLAIDVVRSLDALRVEAAKWLVTDRLALVALRELLRPGLPDLLSRASELVSALLAEDIVGTVAGVRALLGLGPGTTPSGDDALCGIALALRSTGFRRTFDLLSRAVESIDLAEATPALSAAFVRAALSGHCVPEVGTAITAARTILAAATIQGDSRTPDVTESPTTEFDAVLTPLNRIGHSSGHDLFTGFLAALAPLTCADAHRTRESLGFSPHVFPPPPETRVPTPTHPHSDPTLNERDSPCHNH